MHKSQASTTLTFGDYFRTKRIALGFTLRSFCGKYRFDPGNISRLERNILPPSIDERKLESYAEALNIQKGSSEWSQFFDLAHIARGTIPYDIRNNPKIMSFLPAFYRTVRGEKLDKKKVMKLINLLNKAGNNDL
ncbi:helix-turn-helix transcriptional regulator [Candidatus Gottesmanbacteria bacterium]|nr:helix-turn-helix transcriptional regulator [Candidatus Gottesmanbacteria bacterium]